MIDSTWNCSIKVMTHLSNLAHIKINFPSSHFFRLFFWCNMFEQKKNESEKVSQYKFACQKVFRLSLFLSLKQSN